VRATPHDGRRFAAWCAGQTGQPLVDAAMRELAATGYLGNRLRQVAASYLIHDLGCDWRAGAAWFEAQLLDYDVYSNQGNWLYIAGRGTDPRGGRRFDPVDRPPPTTPGNLPAPVGDSMTHATSPRGPLASPHPAAGAGRPAQPRAQLVPAGGRAGGLCADGGAPGNRLRAAPRPKILAIFAAMRDFARQLRAAGHRVRYVALDDASNRQSIPGNLQALAGTTVPAACNGSSPTNGGWTPSCRPGPSQPLAWDMVDSEHFLTARGELAALMQGAASG
jgi:hypothetical protein